MNAGIPRRRRILRLLLLCAAALIALLATAGAASASRNSPAPVPIPAADTATASATAAAGSSASPSSTAASSSPTASTSATCPSGYTSTSNGRTSACTPDPTSSATEDASNNGAFGVFNDQDTLDCTAVTKRAPSECAHVIDDYSVTADDGSWNDFLPKLEDAFTQGVWYCDKVILGIAVFILVWALQFGLAKILLSPVQQLCLAYQQQVIGALGLPTLCMMIAAFLCGMQILFKSRARGTAEFAVSAVIAALATTFLAAPATTLLGDNGVLTHTEQFSVGVAAVSLGQGTDSTDPSKITQPLANALIETFEREPDQVLQYGAVLDSKGHVDPCYYIYDEQIKGEVEYGYTSDQTNPGLALLSSSWQEMSSCNSSYATFNQNPSFERLFVAVAVGVADLFLLVLVILISGGLLVAQFSLGVESIALVFALVLGTLPGGGRAILWRSLGRVVKAVNAVLFSILFVAVFCVFIQTLMAALAGQDLMLRFTLIDVAVMAGLIFHRKIAEAGKDVAFNIQRRLERMKVGGATGSAFVRPTMMYDQRRRSNLGLAAFSAALGAETGMVLDPLGRIGRMAANTGRVTANTGRALVEANGRARERAARWNANLSGGRGGSGGGGGGTGGGGGGGRGPTRPRPPGPGPSAPSGAAAQGQRARSRAVRSQLRASNTRAAAGLRATNAPATTNPAQPGQSRAPNAGGNPPTATSTGTPNPPATPRPGPGPRPQRGNRPPSPPDPSGGD